MKRVYLIRHGATAANVAKLFLGRRDEPLCEVGVEQARKRAEEGVPTPDALFASPLIRCMQTAKILYPKLEPQIIDEFVELDFGRFEGKTHQTLIESDPEYKIWLDSGGTSLIPGGESMAIQRERVRRGFFKMLDMCKKLETKRHEADKAVENVVAVVHGGTIMSLLAELADPPRKFYDRIPKNCDVIACDWDGAGLRVL